MAGKIFVNYRRDDVRAEAARIHDRLASVFGSQSVFMDVDNLLAGQRFDRELEKALSQCDVFLAIMGPRWIDVLHERLAQGERDYVCEEIAAALKRDILVIPVLVEHAKLPKADKLPDEIRTLIMHQKHDITHESFGRDMGALIDAIKAGRRGGRTVSPAAGLLASPWHALGLAAAVVLALVGGALYSGLIPMGGTPAADQEAARNTPKAGATAAEATAEEERRLTDAERAWERVRNSRSIDVLETFIVQFRGTVYAALARDRIADLKEETEAASKTAAELERQRLAALEAADAARKADAKLARGQTFRDCPDCPEMVVIPPGEFLMGTSTAEAAVLAKAYPGSFTDEGPQHKVTFAKPFAVGKSHVTRGEFRVFVNAAGYKIEGGCYAWTDNGWKEETTRTWLAPGFTQDDRHPVVCVSWHDANAYANWLTKVTGKTYRLMSEAEAEYISRAVTVAKQQPRYFFGNDQKDLCTYSNGADETAKAAAPGWVAAPCKDGFIYTAPAANYSPNPFGVYDTNGNVWSWTQDCYAESYSGAPTDGRPAAETQDCNRVLRGGSWIGRPEELGSAVRSKAFPGHHVNIDGFRVARSLNE